MRARIVGAAVALAGMACLSVPAVGTAFAAGPADRYRTQRLHWGTCGAKVPAALQCAAVRVPRDWHRLGTGADLRVEISRIKASRPAIRRGVLLLNPGGPGGSGLYMPLGIKPAAPKVAAAFDLIGFDPRGVGRSTRITCQSAAEYNAYLALDPRDRSAANVATMLDTGKDIAAKCRQRTGDLLRYINTDQTVRDLDLVRQLLGERKISYLGYSAGTSLGANYATTFPRQTDRFVLDSNVEFSTTWFNSFNWQPLGFERRFTDFMGWMAANHRTYGYGTTTAAARARWEARRAALEHQPLKVSDTFTLTAGNLDNGVAGAMYSATSFRNLAASLTVLEHFDTATAAQRTLVENVFGTFFDASLYAVYFAVTCNDNRWPTDQASYVALSDRLGARYPLLGYGWLIQPCASWPYPQPALRPITGRGLPTTLMVNATHDPATPIEGALRAHRALRGSRFLTVRNSGDHGQFGSGNACVDAVVTHFLLTGHAPVRDTVCNGLPLPRPASVATAAAAASAGAAPTRDLLTDPMAAPNVLERVRELTRRYGG